MSKTPINRRFFLKALGGALLTSVIALPVIAAEGDRTLSVQNTHTGERFSGVYWKVDGGYQKEAIKSLNWVLRDHRSNTATKIDVRLFDMMSDLATRLGATGPVQIISGYRSPQTNAMLRKVSNNVAKTSYHMTGDAVDIRLPGVPLRKLQKAALDMKMGGVGYYGGSNFVHIDVGPVRRWGG